MKRSLLTLLALVLVTTACGKDKKDVGGGDTPVTPGGTFPPPPPGGGGTPTPPVYTTGGTADLTIASSSVLEQYTGRVSNGATGFKINIDLADRDSGTGEAFGGSVKISYQESTSSGTPTYYQGHFVSGNTKEEAMYNKFVPHGSSTWFKAFFEDAMGGLIIVVDNITQIDEDLVSWSGRVYFKNFQCGRNPWDPPCNPVRPKRCWFISIGPYDCASFKTGGIDTNTSHYTYGAWKMNTSVRDYPEDYVLLGTFTGLDGIKALNQ